MPLPMSERPSASAAQAPGSASSRVSAFAPALAAALALVGASLAAASPAAEPPALAACEAGHETVLHRAPAGMDTLPARAVWLDGTRLRLPTPAAAAGSGAAAAGGAEAGHAAGAAPAPAASAPASVPAAAAEPMRPPTVLHAPGGAAAAPPTPAPSRWRLYHASRGGIAALLGQPVAGADGALDLALDARPLPAALQQRFKWVGAGLTLALPDLPLPELRALQRRQLLLVQEDAQGRVLQATHTQRAGALDALFAAAAEVPDLGATLGPGQPAAAAASGAAAADTRFKLWAPTAQAVWLCLYDDGRSPARRVLPMAADEATGVWALRLPQRLHGASYTYLVDVPVPGRGLVRNRVTDPYSLSLNTDSQRSWIGDLNHPSTQPPGWLRTPRPDTVRTMTDMVIYELHVRDFSIGDTTVRPAWRGTYQAFTEGASAGMRHLRRMARAGLTDVHLLPIFDLATVPEQGCSTPDAAALAALPPASEQQQATVMAGARGDCFNWGYDPLHFTAPEGSYATRADDGAVRVRELRAMVQALHRAGLRVGMDVVYNHTSASGQHEKSVLDRIVPGYYQRLNAEGRVETSTCCDNTATENLMMAKLMIDSAVVWARDHRIDSFRFDLMGHQPREAMERLQRAVNAATGRHIHLIGEGWNFGEIANGARFVQASQRSLNGSGIASFSDRGRDAARGGGCCDNAQQTQQRQGWLNGLGYAPNEAQPGGAAAAAASRQELLRTADLVRLGLAGTLANMRFTTHDGSVKAGAEIDYAGQPAGFASQPGEVVNYVENHDNQTLYDLHALKLPRATPTAERARVQVLGLALTAFSQGVAYYHAGVEALRSKSGDRNSYDSGDWFNRLDWSFTRNGWGSGLPPKQDNADFWPALRPLLADPALQPTAADIRFTRDAFVDLLAIRRSSTLWRLPTAADVIQRLTLLNTGPGQEPTVAVGHLDGRGWPGAGFAEMLYAINVSPQAQTLTLPTLLGRPLALHPVHRSAQAADPRPAAAARWNAATATLVVPARTAVVWVGPAAR